MRFFKRTVVCLLALLLIVPAALFFLPAKNTQAANGVYTKLVGLQSKFPGGKYWNHVVPSSEAYQDCYDEKYANTVTDSPCYVHGQLCPAGKCDCNYFDGGWQCCGFAKKVFYDLFGERESSNSLIQHPGSSGVQVGDFVKFTWKHYAVVLSVGSSTFTVVECNLAGDGAQYNCMIRWGHSYSLSSIEYYVHSHNWDSVNNTSIPISVSWSQYSTQEIKEGRVFLAKTATLSGAIMNDVADVGIDVYDSNDKYVGGKSEVPDRTGHTYVNIWYDFSSELGLSITPGTVYKYSFWVRINGKKYECPRETVTCPPVYTVKFDSQGGSSVSQLTVGKNQTISNIPTSTRSGYYLDGWYTSATGGTKLTTSTKITGNITYYAQWKKNNYTITLSSVTNGSASLSKTSAAEGEEITVTTSPATGYTLDKITVNGTAISGNKFTMPAKNTTVAVTFKKSDYTVSVSTVNNGTVSVSKTSANYGDEITVTTTPNTGYELDSILVNGTAITGNKFTMPAKNTTVSVTFKKIVYTVSVSEASNGTVNISKAEANYGDEITVATTPNIGYKLDSILVNGTAISGNKFTMPAKNTTVEVAFIKIDYSVDLADVINGKATISKSSANYGDEITVTTTPNTGYTLDSILVNGTAITGNSFTMPAENITVVVTFKKAVYTVFVSEVSNGTVIVSKTEANFGDEITITATPNAGYELDYIKVNGTTLIGDSFLMPSKDVTVEVAFKSTLSIITQPSNYEGTAGSTAKFTVVVEGTGLTYQWQLKKGASWANLSTGGATTSTMSLKVDDSKNGKVYRCVITDAGGTEIVSDSVSITVKQPANAITIKTQPSNYVGPVGSSAKFTVAAEGSGLKYQWQLKKGNSWANLTSGGATTSTMTIKVDKSKNGKVYRCLITDANGEEVATESVSITVKNPSIIINSQPSNYVGFAGSTAKFTVSAEGSGLKYQWQLKKGSSWANLSTGGATTSTMTIKVDDSKNGKVYRCLITSADGEELATESVSITVKQPTNAIVIDTQPTDYSGEVGTTAKFSVAAQGNGLSYQWQLKKGKSWSNLTSGGATTSTMSIKVDTSKDGKTYRCVITDSKGNEVASEEVTIHVVVPVAASVPAIAANETPVVVSNDTPSVTVPEVEATASDEIA